ncbi:hypothetical protein [Roseomonas xinghualingensis]|uniref:hypothetical protein n=1 Tax=Roseomonas xinghualingensis TaxID=2986475 RepID=UPI0021F1EE01|nr:hypothetical protein [Roseomonas sp. SXEYE001]MCV4209998.1 hypothetical protein [Roseomonas sp. SXEYE001]
MLAALLPLALGLAPELAKWVAGDKAGTVAAQAAEMVRTVTGTDDPAASEAILADPVKNAELRIRLAEIAAQREAAADLARLEMFRAATADAASARDMAGKSSLIAWAQVAGFVAVMAVFAAAFLAPIVTGNPAPKDDLMTGALIGVFASVFGFFYGNSTAANTANTTTAALAARAGAAPSPVSIQSAGPVNAAPPDPSPLGTTADALNGAELARIRS